MLTLKLITPIINGAFNILATTMFKILQGKYKLDHNATHTIAFPWR